MSSRSGQLCYNKSVIDEWSSVPYPAWWHERARQRRLELDAAVCELRSKAKSIPHLAGFLVFGSYAQNRVGPDSDLDVIAVTHDPTPLRSDRYLAILHHLNLHVPYDMLVYDFGEYERLSTTWPFVIQARQEGIWIDAASSG